MSPRLLVAAVFLAAGPFLRAEPVQAVSLHPARLWQRADFRLEHVPPAANAFDPDQIRVDVTVTAPSGRATVVPAFWTQDYTRSVEAGNEVLTAAGAPGWRVRFTPTEAGDHALAVAVSLAGGAATAVPAGKFTVPAAAPNGRHGWVRVADDHRYLETTDGRPLRLVGENTCWAHALGTGDYEAWFDAMQQSGQNCARLWCAPWWAGLEQTPGTLNRYDLVAAWQLDRVFELAEQRGIYLLPCLDFHGMYQINNQNWGGSNNFWPRNPYSTTAGGPCAQPNDFFTSPEARALYEKRLRYLVARYGASPQLLAWQFFNEIDNVFEPAPLRGADVIAWHRDMGRWLKAHDPFGHLVTTSLTGGVDRPEMWTLPELDFAVYHSYNDPAPGRKIAALADDFVHRYGKPALIGEFGVSAREWSRPMDPHLRGFRQALWGGALGGAAGTPLPWWWEDIHADNGYTLYAALTAVLQRAGWSQGKWTPAAVTGTEPLPVAVGNKRPDAVPFNASLALNPFRRLTLDGAVAVTGELAAERASEALSCYLRGTVEPARQHPIAVAAWWSKGARVAFHVDSVASDVVLVGRVDGQEVFRTALADRDGQATVNHEIDKEFSFEVPEGSHRVELANLGRDWAYLDAVRVQGVLPSDYAGGARLRPDVVALRQDAKAIVYVVSPWIVYPAGAHRYHAPVQRGETVGLRDWPDGRFRAVWHDPETGREVGSTTGTAAKGLLVLPVPEFSQDLAAIITAAK